MTQSLNSQPEISSTSVYTENQRQFLAEVDRRGIDVRLFGSFVPEVNFDSLGDLSGGTRPPIAYIHTGGTLMMVPSTATNGALSFDGALDIPKTLDACDYLASIKARYRILALKLASIDSKEVRPELWSAIAATIKTIYDKIEGVVIGHGTHTLEYSASGTAFALRNLAMPVVFTASQIPILGFPGSDGMPNLTGSMEIAAHGNLGEVVAYANGEIYRGTRVTKRNDSRLAVFESRVTGPLGYFTGSTVPGKNIELRPGARLREGKRKHELVFTPEFSRYVAALKQQPGMTEAILDKIVESRDTIGIVLETYGSGAVPRAMVPIIEKHTNNGYPIFVSSSCAESGVSATMNLHDEDAIAAHASGLRNVGDMSTTAATVKLMHAVGNLPPSPEDAKPEDRRDYLELIRTEMLDKNYAGEITSKKISEDY